MKIRRYKVIESMGCYVIREAGIRGATGLIGRTFGCSKLEKDAAMGLIEQANHAAELLEALRGMLRNSPDCDHQARAAIANAEGRNPGGK